jgi:Mrp family chromosome partitioning ATPase
MRSSDIADDREARIQSRAEYPVDLVGHADEQEHNHRPSRGQQPDNQDNQGELQASATEPQVPHSSAQDASAGETAAEEMIGAVTSRLMGRVAVIGARPGVDTTPIAVLLARTFAGKGKVVLLDLAPGGPGLSALGADPSVPGISELVAGSASFGEIIGRDRHSGTHFIAAGQPSADVASMVQSPRLVITVEALARSYDHVVINAGTLPDLPLEAIAALAAQAVLVVDAPDDPISAAAQEHLPAAGFSAVNVLQGWSLAPGADGSAARAAA